MGKKGSTTTSGPQMSVTIREASTGKKHTNAKSSLKLQHIKNLAMWATHDASIPSLGAFFGHHFAASSEALATPIDPSLFTCQRCEIILHPGYNCTIRIETNKKNSQRHKNKKSINCPQNNIVSTCHFCSHKNIKKGTPRNLNPPNPKPHNTNNKISSSNNIVQNTTTMGSTTKDTDRGKMGISVKNDAGPTTPLTLLESNMKKRNRSGAKKKVGFELNEEKSGNVSKRKRRKSWTSLKEIAESNDKDNSWRLLDVTVPFLME